MRQALVLAMALMLVVVVVMEVLAGGATNNLPNKQTVITQSPRGPLATGKLIDLW